MPRPLYLDDDVYDDGPTDEELAGEVELRDRLEFHRVYGEACANLRALDEARDADALSWATARCAGRAFSRIGDVAVFLTTERRALLGRSLTMTETLQLRGVVDRVWRVQAHASAEAC